MRDVLDSCTVDLVREAGLISDYLDGLWAEWPEVSTVVATWQREARGPTPRETMQLDLIYDCFPFLFYPDFSRAPLDDVRTLARAGRLYAFHAFLSDGFMDTQDLRRADAVLRSSLVQAEALHHLYSLFPPASPFWPAFKRCQHDYLGALRLEQQWRRAPLADFDLCTAERIGSGKAALTGAAVAAMAILGGDEARGTLLNESLGLAHIGLQFYDDLRDWKDDLLAGQPSLVLAELAREVGWATPPEEVDERTAQIPQLKRTLYASGLAEAAATRAAGYFERAQAALDALSPPVPTPREQLTWRRLLRDCQRATTELARDLRRQAPSPFTAETRTTGTTGTAAANDSAVLKEMLDRAVAYLCAEQGSDGEWGDFLFSIGHSTDWVSGYVGQVLLPLPAAKPQLARAAQWLLRNVAEGGWGYNTRAPRDADSTSNAGLFLAGMYERVEATNELAAPLLAVLRQSRSRLERYQHASGGFSTYTADDGANGYYIVGQSWLEPHLEITATCGRFLLATLEKVSVGVRRALAALLAGQSEDGAWRAYWYEGPFYGTAQVLRFFGEAARAGWRDPRMHASLQRALQFLLDAQRADGGWALRPEDGTSRPVATANALHGLIVGVDLIRYLRTLPRATTEDDQALDQRIAQSVGSGVAWLRQRQRADGSWASSYLLRVPAPDCAEPWLHQFPRSMRGDLNHVTNDQQRLFTVASVVQALIALQAQPWIAAAHESAAISVAPSQHGS